MVFDTRFCMLDFGAKKCKKIYRKEINLQYFLNAPLM